MDSLWTSGFLKKKTKPSDSKAGKRNGGPERKKEDGSQG